MPGADKEALLQKLRDFKTTLIEPQANFISCPMSNLVVSGSGMADITLPHDELASNHGVPLAQDSVPRIDPDNRIVVLFQGAQLPYDCLIVSPKVDFMEKICPSWPAKVLETRR